MKKLFYPVLMAGMMLTAAFTFQSCDKVEDALKVNVPLEVDDNSFTIPAIEAAGDINLTEEEVDFNVEEFLTNFNENYGLENVKSIKVDSCILTLTNATEADNFSVLESCKVQITIGGTTLTIAEVTDNPNTYSERLVLPVISSIELKDFVNAENLTYHITGVTRRGTSIDLNCNVKLKFMLVAAL